MAGGHLVTTGHSVHSPSPPLFQTYLSEHLLLLPDVQTMTPNESPTISFSWFDLLSPSERFHFFFCRTSFFFFYTYLYFLVPFCCDHVTLCTFDLSDANSKLSLYLSFFFLSYLSYLNSLSHLWSSSHVRLSHCKVNKLTNAIEPVDLTQNWKHTTVTHTDAYDHHLIISWTIPLHWKPSYFSIWLRSVLQVIIGFQFTTLIVPIIHITHLNIVRKFTIYNKTIIIFKLKQCFLYLVYVFAKLV